MAPDISQDFIISILCIATIAILLIWRVRMHHSSGSKDVNRPSSLVAFSEARALLELQMEYARRLQHNLVVVTVRVLPKTSSLIDVNNTDAQDRDRIYALKQEQPDRSPPSGIAQLGTFLQETLRTTDVIAFDERKQQIIALLPGSGNAHGEQTAQRIKSYFQTGGYDGLLIGYAEFPGDGLFIDDLIETAEERMLEKRTPEIATMTRISEFN